MLEEIIQYVTESFERGINEKEREIAKKLFNEYHLKIQRLIKNSFSMKVHMK